MATIAITRTIAITIGVPIPLIFTGTTIKSLVQIPLKGFYNNPQTSTKEDGENPNNLFKNPKPIFYWGLINMAIRLGQTYGYMLSPKNFISCKVADGITIPEFENDINFDSHEPLVILPENCGHVANKGALKQKLADKGYKNRPLSFHKGSIYRTYDKNRELHTWLEEERQQVFLKAEIEAHHIKQPIEHLRQNGFKMIGACAIVCKDLSINPEICYQVYLSPRPSTNATYDCYVDEKPNRYDEGTVIFDICREKAYKKSNGRLIEIRTEIRVVPRCR